MKYVLALLSACLLTACAMPGGLLRETPETYLGGHGLNDRPTPAAFAFCLDYGCARRAPAHLDEADWGQVAAPLALPAADPAAERLALAEAVGRFEAATRRTLRLPADRAGTYPGAFAADQNDCVDETANTTTFLLMLAQEGLLRWHETGPPAARGAFVDMALPHRTATLRERATGRRFALDSWFRDSGAPADVAPLEQWLGGWTPPGGAWS